MMRKYKRNLIPATIFFVIGCLLCAQLPLSGARWQEVLTVSGDVEIQWPPSPPPESQAGTTLSATKTAVGFAERWDGVIVYGVRGEICVANGGERPTEGLAILDTVQYKSGRGQFQDYVSKPVDVSDKPVLEAGQEYCYPYELTFAPINGKKVNYRNMVSVTILNHSGWLPGGNHCEGPDPCPFGSDPKVEFTLPDEPTEPPATEPPPTELPPTEPPATEPPPTEPPPTEPPATEPPPTEPPPTEPPATEPPPTEPPPT